MEVSYSAIPEKQYNDNEAIDSSIIIVVPGEVITTEPGFLKLVYSLLLLFFIEVMEYILAMERWFQVFVVLLKELTN